MKRLIYLVCLINIITGCEYSQMDKAINNTEKLLALNTHQFNIVIHEIDSLYNLAKKTDYANYPGQRERVLAEYVDYIEEVRHEYQIADLLLSHNLEYDINRDYRKKTKRLIGNLGFIRLVSEDNPDISTVLYDVKSHNNVLLLRYHRRDYFKRYLQSE